MELHKLNHLPKTKMKNLYVIYGRKSTKPEDRQAASIPRQLQEIQRLVKSRKLKVIGQFVDKGTGWINRDEKDEFYKMLELIKSRGDIKGIIAYDSSRLTRNDSDTGEIKKLLIRGIIDHIITVTEEYSMSNLEYFGFKSQSDFNYSLIVSKNVRISVKNRVENGIAPYAPKVGYRYSNEKLKGYCQHIPDQTQYFVMKKVMDLFLTGNFSVAALHRKAVELNLKNTRGGVISKTALYDCLKDPYYTGKFVYKSDVYAGNHKSLLSDEEFKLVQQILTKSSKPKPKKHEFALNGFIHCGECGKYFCGESHTKTYKNGTQQEFRYYRCTKKGTKCKQPYLQEADLTRQISKYLSNFTIDEDFFNWSVDCLKRDKDEEQERRESARAALELEHTKVIKRLDTLFNMRLDATDAFDIDEINNKWRLLKIEKKNIEDNLEKIYQRVDDLGDLVFATFDFARTAKKKFDNGTLEDKKLVLSAIGSNLTIKDKYLTFQPRNVFLVIKNGMNRVNELKQRLVPEENTIYSDNTDTLKALDNAMRGYRNDVRTSLSSNKNEYLQLKALLLLNKQSQFIYI